MKQLRSQAKRPISRELIFFGKQLLSNTKKSIHLICGKIVLLMLMAALSREMHLIFQYFIALNF